MNFADVQSLLLSSLLHHFFSLASVNIVRRVMRAVDFKGKNLIKPLVSLFLVDRLSQRRLFSQTKLCLEWHRGSWRPTPSTLWRCMCAGKRTRLGKSTGGGVKAGVAAGYLVFPPSSAFFVFHFYWSFMCFVERGDQNPNSLASNIEKILTSTSLFLCGHFLSTKDNNQFLKGMKNLVAKGGYKLKICYEYMNRGDRWMQVNPMRIYFRVKLYLHSSFNLTGTSNLFSLQKPKKTKKCCKFYMSVRMSWSSATSTRLTIGFPSSWIHRAMGICRTFLIKSFWWETQWTPLSVQGNRSAWTFYLARARRGKDQNFCMGGVVQVSLLSAAPTSRMIRGFVASSATSAK